VIVKPLFGSMGLGMARVEDPDVAQRVFRALELERAVYYLQEFRSQGHDVRAFVVGDRVVAAIQRVGAGWRANLAQGARAEPVALEPRLAELCVRACAVLGADYAGVDLLGEHVLEVNGIPGWSGVERACGVDVAGELVQHVERVVAS
jgi:RimK family alpha-L-glutamate ligase